MKTIIIALLLTCFACAMPAQDAVTLKQVREAIKTADAAFDEADNAAMAFYRAQDPANDAKKAYATALGDSSVSEATVKQRYNAMKAAQAEADRAEAERRAAYKRYEKAVELRMKLQKQYEKQLDDQAKAGSSTEEQRRNESALEEIEKARKKAEEAEKKTERDIEGS